MPNIFKRFSFTSTKPESYEFSEISSKAESYVFPEISSLKDMDEEAEQGKKSVAAEGMNKSEDDGADEIAEHDEKKPQTPIDFANIQADAILADARREAEEILEKARADARKEAEQIYNDAREAGRMDGYADGALVAQQEGQKEREAQAARLEMEVEKFFERAGAAIDRQLDSNMDDLRDLAIAIAEKVICISLRSSTEIIGKMVQTALDKHKHREWVHIYIAECDAKRMGQLPTSLITAMSALSDRVRIIPMADDESGTCVIETPDEIIDASTSTQLSNIRSLLASSGQTETEITNFSL